MQILWCSALVNCFRRAQTQLELATVLKVAYPTGINVPKGCPYEISTAYRMYLEIHIAWHAATGT